MSSYTLTRETVIDKPLDEVFSFFSRPENLARITPPQMGFIIVSPPPIEMKTGAVIDYTVRVMGMRLKWRTLIEDYSPPEKFVDIQIRGPYKLWRHTHTFEEKEGRTIMRDHVDYALPFGFIGRMVHALTVKRQLKAIFDYRLKVISEIFSD